MAKKDNKKFYKNFDYSICFFFNEKFKSKVCLIDYVMAKYGEIIDLIK